MSQSFENIVLGERYKLIEQIGVGGMAYVYKAMDVRLNRLVAVKILKAEFTDNKDFVQRFGHEAMSAASMTHPNIVSIYDAGQDNGVFYIVMELVEGITLKELIDKKKFIKWKDALAITKQILSAMEIAHKNNIIHRDIKPHNVILTYDGVAKVADFGIARVVSGTTRDVSDVNIGSVHYISPEQAKGEPFDERADLYSIGITLFEMMTGHVPFDGDTAVAVAIKNIREPLKPPHEINPAIPVGVSDFVVRATMKDPEERYQSAVDMLSSLQVVMLIPNEHLSYSSVYAKKAQKKQENTVKNKNGFKDFIIKNYKETVAITVAVILSIVVFSISFGSVSGNIRNFRSAEYVMVDFSGKNIDDVRSKLEKLNIYIEIVSEVSSEYSKGTIISQNIEAGDTIKSREKAPENDQDMENVLRFNVSIGENDFEVGDFKDTDERIINNTITPDMRINKVIVPMYSSEIAKDKIINTKPGAGETLNPGDTIYIYQSLGSYSEVKADDYKGMTPEQAKSLIEAKGLKCEIKRINKPDDNIDQQDPNAGNNIGATAQPSQTPTLEPTPTPTPKPENIVWQYPVKGTIMNVSDTIYLYTSAPEEYRTRTRTVVLEENQDMNLNSNITFKVEITPSDTGVKMLLEEYSCDKSIMPYVFNVPMPDKGSVEVEVYIDNKKYCQYTLYSD